MARKTQQTMVFLLVFSLISALALAAFAAPGRAAGGWQVVANGLNNPRGLAFGDDGSLYIAEAGFGGPGHCVTGPEGDEVCLGLSGSVTRLQDGKQERFLRNLPSLAAFDGLAATGPTDVIVKGRNVDVIVGLGADPAERAIFGQDGACLGYQVRASWTGAFACYTDVAGFETANNPDGGELDSNPYAMTLIEPGKRIIADAGGNDVMVVFANGQTELLTVFPDTMVDAPPFLGLPPGAQIPMQAVPNTVAIGPDNAIYVGQLTGFPFPVGGAKVYRVIPGQPPEVFADGFTNIIDIAFDKDGNLYVLEITANGLLSGDFTGALIKVAPDGTRTELARDGLVAPGGLAIGPDGAIYVSNFSVFAGAGQVIRLSAENASAPAPAAAAAARTVAHGQAALKAFTKSIPEADGGVFQPILTPKMLFLPFVNH